MTKLIEAMNETALTENGMLTLHSSLDGCVDLFFKIGASRGKDIIPAFEKAFVDSPDHAIRIALWSRDIRQGAGERQLFRNILTHLANTNSAIIPNLLEKIVELGRWDDLFALMGTPSERLALEYMSVGLLSRNALCAKWMPRKGEHANSLRRFMQLTPKTYRKLLVSLTNVVETKMCAKEFDSIEFDKLPSLASARYQKAFGRNAKEKYDAYLKSLEKGETTINAGAVYPYDIIKSIKNGGSITAANEQWKALPDFIKGSEERILPLVDVSGSMTCCVAGSTSAMDIAVSLGLYISERMNGVFKDTFLTFSQEPELIKVKGTLNQRMTQMINSKWGMNTDLKKVFSVLLNQAKKFGVPENEMPTKILILSDMQFDACTSYNDTAMKMIERSYEAAGYEMPQIIFWNLRNSNGVPVTFDKRGTALISGFSPSIMKSILGGKILSPEDVMLDTIMSDRYKI